MAPKAEDQLITVDSAEKKISADEYADSQGNVWTPVSATVVYEQGNETVEINNGVGTYSYAGNQYSVEVLYEIYKTVNNQQIVANIPYYLSKGIQNLEILANDCSVYYGLMVSYIPRMMALTDGSLGGTLSDGPASQAIVEQTDRRS